MWISPNKRVKNRIAHLLINDMVIVKDYHVLSQFEFQSDHRLVRCKIQIPRRARFKGHCRKRGNVETVMSCGIQ